MQALHFSFGLGAFVAPLLAAPFLEPAFTIIPFQVSDRNGTGIERGKRDFSQNGQNITRLLNTDMEALNSSFLEFTTKSLENASETSNLVLPDTPGSTISTLRSVELNSTYGLDANETAVLPTVTTRRVPKRKPSKTNASSLGNTNWDRIHVGTVPKEDLIPVSSTSTVSSSTATSVTASPMFPFLSPTSERYSKLNQPLLLRAKETTALAKETNTSPNPSSIYESTDFTGSFESTNEDNDTDYSKSITISPVSNNENSTAKCSTQSITNNTYSKEINNPLIINNSNFINVSGRSSGLIGESLTGPSSTEGTVSKIGLSSYMQVMTTPSYEESPKTQAYTISKIPEESVPSVVTEAVTPHVKLSTDVPRDQGTQAFTDYTSNTVNEEHRPEQSTFSATNSTSVKTLEVIAPAGNLLSRHIHHSKPVTYDNDTEVINTLFDTVANRIEKYGFSRVQFTYLMVGLFIFAISLVFLGFLCHNPRDPKSKQEEGQGTKKISNKALHGLLITLMAVFFLLYVGLEVTYGQLVLAFAVHSDLQLAQSTGLVIAVVFWGSFAAMRFASIFFSSGFGPITMLLLNFVFCTVGTLLLSIMASRTETALWVGTALLGVGLASVFPTGILWIERYIHVSNKVAAAFVVGASLGEMVCPVAVYQLMVNNPAMLMHSAVVINILCIVTFIVLRWLALRFGEKYCAVNSNGYQLASQEEEEDMIDTSPTGSVVDLRHSFSSEHRALLNGNPHRGP
jgi:hypothetical protein